MNTSITMCDHQPASGTSSHRHRNQASIVTTEATMALCITQCKVCDQTCTAAGSQGSAQYYSLVVPAGKTTLSFTTSG